LLMQFFPRSETLNRGAPRKPVAVNGRSKAKWKTE
jgi:hypothetical protein